MNFCNIESAKGVQELRKTSTPKDDSLFYATVDKWLYDYDRLPNADEFPSLIGVDSLHYLKDTLKLKDLGSGFGTSTDELYKYTGKDTPEQAAQALGELHKDYNFRVINVGETSIIQLEKRPTDDPKEVDILPNLPTSPKAVGHLIDRIKEIHGINIHEVTNRDVALLEDFPGAVFLNGFIRNGEVFVNTDNATPNTELHELMHLFMGGVRFQNPYLYQNLLQISMKHPEIQYRMNQFRHRTEMDRAEEVLVEEVSKYLRGENSILSTLSAKDKYELDYCIRRLLDTMLNGDFSNKIIDSNKLYKSTLEKVARIVNSREVFNNISEAMKYGYTNRSLNNYKQKLLKTGELTEVC